MWNDSFSARFAGPYRSEAAQDPVDERGAGARPSRHGLDVGYHDRVDYERVLPLVEQLCRRTARYREQSSEQSSGPSADGWHRQWNQCAFVWDQWAASMRSDLAHLGRRTGSAKGERGVGDIRDVGGALGATGITANNLGCDYRAFADLEARWLRATQARTVPVSPPAGAGRPALAQPSMASMRSTGPHFPPHFPPPLVPTAPPLSMPWMDDMGVAWPPSSVSGQDPSPGRSSWRP